MSEPNVGDITLCSQCGEKIVYIGPHWNHRDVITPKHPALPAERQSVTVDLDKLRARMNPTADTDLLFALVEDQHLQVQQARERERVATDTYNGQQQSHRELETLYQGSQERALKAEAELARLRASVRDLREINAQQRREVDAERASRRAFEADAAQLRATALAYVMSVTYEDRERLRAELHVLATVEHPGVLLVSAIKQLQHAWDKLSDCSNEFEPEDMTACAEYRDQLDTAILAVLATMKEST